MTDYLNVIPAKAGIQTNVVPVSTAAWIPAFAGMTAFAGAGLS